MSVNYGVLKGKIIDAIPYKEGADHFQIEVQAGDIYRIAVDVYSQFAGTNQHSRRHGHSALETDRMVMFYKDENYQHSITAEILKVNEGFTPKKDLDPAICLDYLSFNPPLFPLDAMRVVAPKSEGKPGEDLNDDINPWVQKALNNVNADVYAFGSGWNDNEPGGHPDVRAYFDPNPSLGIHDIHFNQGDVGREARYNGRNQDGALFFHFTDENLRVAMFFKFQNQSTNNDENGNPVN